MLPAAKADFELLRGSVAALSNKVEDNKTTLGNVEATTATIEQKTANYDEWALRLQMAQPIIDAITKRGMWGLAFVLIILVAVGYLTGKLPVSVARALISRLGGGGK